MRRIPTALAIAAVLAAAPAAAQAPCDPAVAEVRLDRIRRHLDREHKRARRWDLAWTITFGVLAAGQGALRYAEYSPVDEYDRGVGHAYEVGVGKSTIAMAAHIVLPLKIVRAPDSGDACADLEAAERAVRATATNEKRSFWLNHLGSILLNAGGAIILGAAFDEWGEAGKSVLLGYPVGLLSTYTMPRGTWHFDLSVGLTPTEGGAGLVVTGAF